MSNVFAKSGTVANMSAGNAVIAALLGGTNAMRAAGKAYLPQWPQESEESYKLRLQSSTLLPVMRETIGQMVGRVFFKDVDTDKVSGSLKPLLDNVDLQNNNLSVFCSAWFADALAFGSSYVLVDFPSAEGNRTLADDKAQGLRPYAVLIRNADVLGWRSELRNGVPVCTQFRYQQSIVVPDGDFGEKTIEQVNVLEPGLVRRYRKDDNGAWALHEENLMQRGGNPLDYVPVVELVPEKTGFFIGRPPLLELAHLNVKHWQSQSDQDNIVHYVRVPLLAYSGEEDVASVAAAAGNMITLGKDGVLQYVEHSGAAIAAGVNALEKLEADMQAAGAKLLTRTKLALTDSQARDEQGKEISLLRHYANLLEDAIGRLLDMMGRWAGIEDAGAVEISGNIDADYNPVTSLDVLLKMNTAGAISDQTLFDEAKRRGVVSDIADWATEKERLKQEAESAEPAGMMFDQQVEPSNEHQRTSSA